MRARYTAWICALSAWLTQCTSAEPAARDAGEAVAFDAGRAASADAGSSDEGAFKDSGLLSCGSTRGLCPLPDDFQLQLLLASSSFGPNARFAAMGGRTVLVTEPDQPARVVQLRSPADPAMAPGSYRSLSLPSTELEVVDVSDDGRVDAGSLVYALVCSAAAQCKLWRSGVTDDAKLEPIAGSELSWKPRGLVMDPVMDSPVPCVYGRTLTCFDGAWHESLAPAGGLELIDVALGRGISFAIGSQTRAWIRTQPTEGWQPQWVWSSSAHIELSSVSVSDRYGGAFGTRGELLGLEEDTTWLCQWDAELALVSPGNNSLDQVTVVTKQGRVLRRSRVAGANFCESQQLDAGAILFSSRVSCGASGNIWIATESEVWGERTCVEVP